MADFYSYLGLFFQNWWLYMTAGPLLLGEVAAKLSPKFKQWLEVKVSAKTRRNIEIAVISLGVFAAGYLAFEDEHAKRLADDVQIQSLTAQLAAQSPSAQASQVKYLTAEVGKLEKQQSHVLLAAEPDPDEWPALTDAQITRLATAILPLHVKKIEVYWGQEVEANKLFKSLQAVGKLADVPVIADGGQIDVPGIEIFPSGNDSAASAIQTLLGELTPQVWVDYEGSATSNSDGVIQIFIGEKPAPTPPSIPTTATSQKNT